MKTILKKYLVELLTCAAVLFAGYLLSGCSTTGQTQNGDQVVATIHALVQNGITDFNAVMTNPAVSNAVVNAISTAPK